MANGHGFIAEANELLYWPWFIMKWWWKRLLDHQEVKGKRQLDGGHQGVSTKNVVKRENYSWLRGNLRIAGQLYLPVTFG